MPDLPHTGCLSRYERQYVTMSCCSNSVEFSTINPSWIATFCCSQNPESFTSFGCRSENTAGVEFNTLAALHAIITRVSTLKKENSQELKITTKVAVSNI